MLTSGPFSKQCSATLREINDILRRNYKLRNPGWNRFGINTSDFLYRRVTLKVTNEVDKELGTVEKYRHPICDMIGAFERTLRTTTVFVLDIETQKLRELSPYGQTKDGKTIREFQSLVYELGDTEDGFNLKPSEVVFILSRTYPMGISKNGKPEFDKKELHITVVSPYLKEPSS